MLLATVEKKERCRIQERAPEPEELTPILQSGSCKLEGKNAQGASSASWQKNNKASTHFLS